MSSILFYTGGRCEPLGEHAVKAFENEELVTFLSTDIIGYDLDTKIHYLESSDHSEWRVRNGFDLDLDYIDTDRCRYFILQSVSDWAYKLVSREPNNFDSEYFIRRIECELLRLIKEVRNADANMIIIAYDVSHAIDPENKKEQLEQIVISVIDRFIAEIADGVTIFEFGIPRKIK